MPNSNENPFEELPEALVDEMLSQSEQVGDTLYQSFEEVQRQRQVLRGVLEEKGFLRRDAEIGYPPIPTTSGCAVRRRIADRYNVSSSHPDRG